ncbi:MAG: hypothetical protein KC493_04395 [Bacteriovoracaceae bacterium]|nr:hypothetical protein [Bacteriovoracaceae bacterium]
MATRIKSGRWQKFSSKIKNVLFSSQGFPLFLGFTLLSVLFVIFRMKGVEIDYKISGLDKDLEKVTLENKELKARRARLLSVKKLKSMAKKYNLSQPKQGQILVIR